MPLPPEGPKVQEEKADYCNTRKLRTLYRPGPELRDMQGRTSQVCGDSAFALAFWPQNLKLQLPATLQAKGLPNRTVNWEMAVWVCAVGTHMDERGWGGKRRGKPEYLPPTLVPTALRSQLQLVPMV